MGSLGQSSARCKQAEQIVLSPYLVN